MREIFLSPGENRADEKKCLTAREVSVIIIPSLSRKTWKHVAWRQVAGKGFLASSGYGVLPGQFPERSNGTDCKSVGTAFGGSNPSLPTYTCPCGAAVAHSLGKTGVMGSIPITGSCSSLQRCLACASPAGKETLRCCLLLPIPLPKCASRRMPRSPPQWEKSYKSPPSPECSPNQAA